MADLIQLLIGVGLTAILLILGLIVGGARERGHFKRLAAAEATRSVTLNNLKRIDNAQEVEHAQLVMGQCVVASDYFKTFVSAWKKLVGGELRGLQSLMTRARRQALVRLMEEAEAAGADEVWNVRFESSNISAMNGKKGAAQVEVLAFGTAVVRRKNDLSSADELLSSGE